MVIHYDPWWNLSAENQATDRTYRIGQKRNVQVYKLITKNSIEEKIYEVDCFFRNDGEHFKTTADGTEEREKVIEAFRLLY